MDSNKSQTHSAPPTPSRSPSHAGDQQECPESPLIPNIPVTLKRGEKTRVKKMEDAVCSSFIVIILGWIF